MICVRHMVHLLFSCIDQPVMPIFTSYEQPYAQAMSRVVLLQPLYIQQFMCHIAFPDCGLGQIEYRMAI
jgi:hypothetical protein